MKLKKLCVCGRIIAKELRACPACLSAKAAKLNKDYDTFKRDKERAAFYHSKEWKALRNSFLNKHPFCKECGKFAKIIDHIVPISQGGAKLDPLNLQALCHACHNTKTARENKAL